MRRCPVEQVVHIAVALRLSRHVDNCQTYADLVYQEVISGRLEIKELSSE